MKPMISSILFASLTTACAAIPPSPAQLAQLPVIVYPDKPGSGDYVYKLPAGKPIDLHLIVDGSALSKGADLNANAQLAHDIYLHKNWASEDGKKWVAARKLIEVKLGLTLPSYDSPKPGEIHLSVDRKETQQKETQ